jgi:hypothetical protein
MALVAASIAVVIAMAALSIDVGTLYEASAEAQRSADAAALAAARVLSLSGMTGDPTNSSGDWSKACTAASQAAQSVAGQNFVGGAVPTVNVSFVPADGCTSSGGVFGVNPMVTVKVSNTTLPTFFAHIFGLFNSAWSTASASATATAEVYNPSNSTTVGGGTMVTVQPRCVKPLIIPNFDPLNPPAGKNGKNCTFGTPCQPFVNTSTGTVVNGGILLSGSGTGVIGETFNLFPDCTSGSTGCNPVTANPHANPSLVKFPNQPPQPNLLYVPGQVLGTPVGVPACATTLYQQAIAGCDQSTPYQCGVQAGTLGSSANQVDLSENPIGANGDTATAAECLIHESGEGPTNSGQDTLATSSFPYQVVAGSANPLGITGDITSSSSVITVPIYDSSQPLQPNGTTNLAPVTIIGFLQVFINWVNTDGSLNVTVLNVAGCGNTATVGANGTPFVTGTSPVPIRLITPQ